MGFLRRFFEFLSRPSHSRTMGLVVMLLLVTAVSLTVYVAQQQQQLKQQAGGVCVKIDDIDSIPQCSPDISTDDPCSSEGDRCRIGSLVHECTKQ